MLRVVPLVTMMLPADQVALDFQALTEPQRQQIGDLDKTLAFADEWTLIRNQLGGLNATFWRGVTVGDLKAIDQAIEASLPSHLTEAALQAKIRSEIKSQVPLGGFSAVLAAAARGPRQIQSELTAKCVATA